jgi:hypothetical protein
MNPSVGRMLIVAGVILIIAGVFFLFGSKIPFLGKLPGDISYKKGNTAIYFPIVTCLILSMIISVVLFLINKFKA